MIDLQEVLKGVLEQIWWIPIAIIVLFFFRSPWFKGFLGELLVRVVLRSVESDRTRRFDDLLLSAGEGTTQIDHVLVTPAGVFVIETKNMQGWIFGDVRQRQWTQVTYRSKQRFQNPLHQNYKHIKAIQDVTGLEDGHLHSAVVFVGGATFKTGMPGNVVRLGGLKRYLNSFDEPLLSMKGVEDVSQAIERYAVPSNRENRKAHVSMLKKSSRTTTTKPETSEGRSQPGASCPKCGNDLVMRKARKGASAGASFWGCSTYPSCRYTKPAGQ